MDPSPPPPPPPSGPQPPGPAAGPPPPPPFAGAPGAPGAPGPYPVPPGVGPVGRPAQPSAGMATAALVCGIVGLVLFVFLVPSIVALVLGLIAAGRARRNPAPGDGRGRATAGWILGLLGVLAFVAFVIAAIALDEDVSVFELDPGDCVDVPDGTVTDDPIQELPGRECDEPHDAEVYLVDELTGEGDYPGDAAVAADVDEICQGNAFERYVGRDYASSRFNYYYLYPSEDGWEQGDQEYVCLVTVDGSQLTSSVAGSGE